MYFSNISTLIARSAFYSKFSIYHCYFENFNSMFVSNIILLVSL